jgi:serine-type D-Ala-D-Ala carboxypeptidase/endopeptidase
MQLFIQAHLDPRYDDLGKSIELAWEQHLPAKGGSFAMGLGWHIARDGSTRWHNGQTGGYHSMLMINRPLKAGVVVLCNTASGDVDWIGESVIQLLAGMDVKPQELSNVKVSEDVLARLQGEYELTPEFVLTVTAKSGRLFVQATKQLELRVYPHSETKWFYREVDAQLTFELPETGAATALTLHQNGQDMKALKRK